MDTSETYIKMCREASKFLPPKKPVAWDCWYMLDEREEKNEALVLSAYPTDSGVYGPGLDLGDLGGYKLLFPIYRQDQLQEMVGEVDIVRLVWRFYRFSESCHPSPFDPDGENFVLRVVFTSMEQLWLAFVMAELHQKKWNGSEWVGSKET